MPGLVLESKQESTHLLFAFCCQEGFPKAIFLTKVWWWDGLKKGTQLPQQQGNKHHHKLQGKGNAMEKNTTTKKKQRNCYCKAIQLCVSLKLSALWNSTGLRNTVAVRHKAREDDAKYGQTTRVQKWANIVWLHRFWSPVYIFLQTTKFDFYQTTPWCIVLLIINCMQLGNQSMIPRLGISDRDTAHCRDIQFCRTLSAWLFIRLEEMVNNVLMPPFYEDRQTPGSCPQYFAQLAFIANLNQNNTRVLKRTTLHRI